MTATDRLTGALVVLAAAGGSVPCGEYGGHLMWTSDDPDERALAARCCVGCPVFSACGDAADANDERFGVWAGVDRGKQLGVKVTGAHGTKAASEVNLSRTDLPAPTSVPRAATRLRGEHDEIDRAS